MRAFLHASFVLWLAYRDALIALAGEGDAVMMAAARRLEVDYNLVALREWCRILLARYLLTPARQRPRFKGRLRLAILLYGERFSLSWAEVARDFGLRPSTLYRWLRRRRIQGDAALLRDAQPIPPPQRYADTVRELIVDMKRAGFPGDGTIASALRHVGHALSHDTVGRILLSFGFTRKGRRKSKNEKPARRSHAPARSRHLAQPTRESRTRARQIAQPFVALADTLRLHLGDAVAQLRRLRPNTRGRRHDELALQRDRLAQQLRILREHMARIDPARRPFYTPELRLAILAFKHRYRLSHEQLAWRFLLHPNTVCTWNVCADEDGPPALIAAHPPLRSTQAAIERALAGMPRLRQDLRARLRKFLDTICASLPQRASRLRRRPEENATTTPRRWTAKESFVALYRNHFWTADFTVFWQQDRPDWYLLAIVDVFSRKRLAFALFVGEPSAEQAAALLRSAIAAYSAPKYFVSDQGSEFTGGAFIQALAQHGTEPRLGAVGQKGSIAIIERFWLTLKTSLETKTILPLLPDTLAERIGAFMDWYDSRRPHSSLACATPAEVYSGTPSPAKTAVPPPRGRPGQPCQPLGVAIRFALEQERRLPYLERVA